MGQRVFNDQLARGKAYPTAIRALALKWQQIMFVVPVPPRSYDETTYLQSLKRRGSHLAKKLDLYQILDGSPQMYG